MAGSPAKRRFNEQLQERIEELVQENAMLREKLAIHAPEALASDLPPPINKYSKLVADRVLAMGRQGMDENQWIAGLGLSSDVWDQWVLQHEQLSNVAKQAHAAMTAYWSREMDRAIRDNNTRFPINVARDKINSSLRMRGGDLGDASKLVLVDLRHERCPHCLKTISETTENDLETDAVE